MLEMPNGLIRMTPAEISTYQGFAQLMSVPATKQEFTQTVQSAIDSMRSRITDGCPQEGDTLFMAEVIEDYLANPHAAELEERRRKWIAAGCPMGEEDMRKAGLTSPALDRLQRERDAVKQPDTSESLIWPILL